jgi:hypothetical protein
MVINVIRAKGKKTASDPFGKIIDTIKKVFQIVQTKGMVV